jgi:hypothetical protein
LFSLALLGSGHARAEGQDMIVYKTPTCGCCDAWVEHVEAAGFTVEVQDLDDLSVIKQMSGVPDELQSCHTAIIDGKTVEGHVPAHAIQTLLDSVDGAHGLAVPGMPQGSPGMPSPTPEPYDIFAFGASETTVVGRYKGDQPAAD